MYCADCGSPVKKKETYCKDCLKKRKASQAAADTGKERRIKGGAKWIVAGAVGIGLLTVGALAVRENIAGGEQKEKPQYLSAQTSSWENIDRGENVPGVKEPVSGGGEENAVNLTQQREERILALSQQQWMLEQAARNLTAERLAATSFVTVDPREQFSAADVILDGVTGNLIISEGARAMYQSVSQGRSASDICRSTLESAAAQVPQYLSDRAESALQDMVTDLIGVDVFSALDFISQLQNADDMPVVLLQQIVDEQRRDVYKLTIFLEQEKISAADMYKVAQLMYAIQTREQEIAAVRGTAGGGSETDYRDIRTLAGQYAANETELLYLAQAEVLKEGSPDGDAREALAERQKSILERMELYSVLAQTEQGDISVNYDVEGFREAQKTVSQEGTLDKLLTGDLLGGFLAEGGQQNEDWLQENRARLCDGMTDYMEESYLEVASARADFMGQYGALGSLLPMTGESGSLAESCLEQTPWEIQLDGAANAYLTALAKYRFDLESAYILYDCILTDSQADYLFTLELELDQTVKALQSCQTVEYGGYSEEEAADRWCELLEDYKQILDQTVDRSLALGGNAPGIHANGYLTVYGETTYKAYSKEPAADSRPLTIVGGTGNQERNPRYYYDTSGNLLCAVYGINRIVYRGGLPVVFFIGEEKHYSWDLEPGGWELQRMSEYGNKAQDMYNRFVNGM